MMETYTYGEMVAITLAALTNTYRDKIFSLLSADEVKELVDIIQRYSYLDNATERDLLLCLLKAYKETCHE